MLRKMLILMHMRKKDSLAYKFERVLINNQKKKKTLQEIRAPDVTHAHEKKTPSGVKCAFFNKGAISQQLYRFIKNVIIKISN